MQRYIGPSFVAMAAGVMASFAAGAAAQTMPGPYGETAAVVHVLGGTATFEARTNISAINVHGKSASLAGRAQVRHSGDVITIERMEATLPVKTITTGMGLRDEHMRKYVFTAGDGAAPDLRYTGDKADCSPAPGLGLESICTVSGRLAIRGTERPFAITLKVRRTGDTYRAAGDGTVKLSTYGIARPSQLGVTTTDEVKLHLDFTAKAANGRLVARAGEVR
jgi:polyisoprenoid-binding protein YceI